MFFVGLILFMVAMVTAVLWGDIIIFLIKWNAAAMERDPNNKLFYYIRGWFVHGIIMALITCLIDRYSGRSVDYALYTSMAIMSPITGLLLLPFIVIMGAGHNWADGPYMSTKVAYYISSLLE